MLSFGAGLTGILSASFALDSGPVAMLASGAAGSALMIVLTILGGNLVNAFGTGVPPVNRNPLLLQAQTATACPHKLQ